MAVKLIAFDMDGTFLDDDKNIPPENLRALEKAHRQGIILVPATGRILNGIPENIKSLPYIRYYILVNGAQVYDSVEEKVLFKAEIPLELGLRLMDYMDTLPVIYDCYQYDKGWMSADMYARIDEFVKEPGKNKLVKTLRTPVPDLRKLVIERGEPLQKQQMFFKDMDELHRQHQILPKLFPELLPSTSVKTNIELNTVDAGKDKGLAALCEHLGIDIRDTMAFGDGTNDTSMLRAAGIGVAMSNAEEEVLQAADKVTCSNNEAGVAEGIYRWALA